MDKSSFRWTIQEYEVINETEKQIRVKVKALRPIMSRNGRKYDFDEMMQSHRSMRGQIINVNHNNTRVIGNTDGTSINREQQVMEVMGVVNKEPYVSKLKAHDPAIKGWSVQADFYKARCVHCQKEFESMETLKTHLVEEEHIHNVTFAPTEIKFNGLALVMDPEEPGVPGTSYEIAETVKKFGSLQELVDTFESSPSPDSWLLRFMSTTTEEKPMSKIALEPAPSSIAVGKSRTVSMPTPPITEKETKAVPNDPPKIVDDKKDNTHTEAVVQQALLSTPLTETFTLRESAGLPKLEFIAEGCQYTTFDACVADGKSRKECAALFDSVEERNLNNRKIVDVYNKVAEFLNSPIIMTIPKETPHSNLATKEELSKIAEMINALPKDDLGWKELKPYNDAPLKTSMEALGKSVQETLPQMATKQALTEALKPLTDKLTILEAENKTLKESVISQKSDFEKILSVADKNIAETKKTLEERIANLDKENKNLKETLSVQEKTLQETKIVADNADDKLTSLNKGKAHTPFKQPETTPNFNYNPGGK